MGASLSRNRNGQEDTPDVSTHSAYRYPPKTGSYFGSYFIMGGERFESPQPGEYLFGDSEELNFLGNKPVPFPYPVPSGNEPTRTLKSLVYIRKDSIRLVKVTDNVNLDGSAEGNPPQYSLEFLFDCDVKCAIRVHYFCAEEVVNGQVVYHPKDPSLGSDLYHYQRGAGQSFNQPSHTLDPSKFSDEEWQYNFDKEVYPIAIHCFAEEEEHLGHSHITYAMIEKSQEGSYTIKPLKQKQVVDGVCYLLQEIYGIENKNVERLKDIDPDDEVEDSGAECVICMSDMRDTLILPCRHLCLCSSCADSLRYQASMCPICRVKFRALLQIRAMRKKVSLLTTNTVTQSDSDENSVNQEGVPSGYEAISLIEALNGQVVPPLSGEGVHLQISGPPTVFPIEKKGQKETKVTVSGPIEYQKEMDTDKESSKGGTLEKQKNKDKMHGVTDLTSTEAASDVTPEESSLPGQELPPGTPRATPKSTVVTVRCSPDGKMITETKISKIGESDLAPIKAPNKRLHEREYKSGNLGRMACGLSTGDMADDEREDSSEPEPDYDDAESEPGSPVVSPKSSSHSLYKAASATLATVDVEHTAAAVGGHHQEDKDVEGKDLAAASSPTFSTSPKPKHSAQQHRRKRDKSAHASAAMDKAKKVSAAEMGESAGTRDAHTEGAVAAVMDIPAYHQVETELPAAQAALSSSARSRSSQRAEDQHQPQQREVRPGATAEQRAGYDTLKTTSLSDVYSLPSSGTEGSSFGSHCSDHALLPQGEGGRSESNVEEEEEDADTGDVYIEVDQRVGKDPMV